MDETDQMDGSAFVAARHAAVMLDVAEAPFDPIAMLVDAEVVGDHPLSGHIRDPVAQVGAAITLYRRERLWRADMPPRARQRRQFLREHVCRWPLWCMVHVWWDHRV